MWPLFYKQQGSCAFKRAVWSSKTKKILGISLTKKVKDLYHVNYYTPKKESEDTNGLK
jgi:hypothetical protein